MQEKWIRLDIPMDVKSEVIISWVDENVNGKYHYKPYNWDSLMGYCNYAIKFEESTDALAFRLTWL